MDTLLLVEDDKILRQTLKENLEEEEFLVFEASVGKRLLEILKRHHVDLILLDLKLPDGSGLSFIDDIRRQTDVPLIIVSGEKEKSKKINGFDLGADDYIHKPFEIDELIARIRANLRRYKGNAANENEHSLSNNQIQINDWTLTPDQYQLFDRSGKSADLTIQEFKLLQALTDQPGKAIKRQDLCEILCQDGSYSPTERAIDVKITRIRKKIGDDAANPAIIKTVRGIGYMFCS